VVLTKPSTRHKAVSLMVQSVKATRALKSFDCTLIVQIHGFGKSPALVRTEKVRVWYDGPKRMAIRQLSFAVEGPEGKDKDALAFPGYYHDVVADGHQYYVLDRYQAEYLLHPLNPKGVAKETVSAGVFADDTVGNILFEGGSFYISNARKGGKYRGNEKVRGVDCAKLWVAGNRTTYWIGLKDSLIRRCETQLDPPMTIIEDYTFHSVNRPVPSTAFSISPPASASLVRKFGEMPRGSP
jgi:hypothetical protein